MYSVNGCVVNLLELFIKNMHVVYFFVIFIQNSKCIEELVYAEKYPF